MSNNSRFSVSKLHPNLVRQLFFLSFLIFIGLVIISELYFMTGSFLGAVTLYVILMNPMKRLVILYKWKPWLAALILIVTTLILMIIPLAYMMSIAIQKLKPLIDNPSIIESVFQKISNYLIQNYQIEILNAANVQKISDQVLPVAQKTFGGTLSFIGNIFLMYLVLYFMLVQSRQVELWLKKNVPFKTANVKKIITDIRNLVYSNALGIPIVALIQGMVGTIGYYIFGVEEYLLMGILTAIASVIPIIGTLVIYLPLAIFQYITFGAFEGFGVALWGLIVIGSVDNIARFLVQKKLANVHPLITLLGVIMGINLFGFIGVIFGPLMLSVFFILGKIYIDEFGKVDANKPYEISTKVSD